MSVEDGARLARALAPLLRSAWPQLDEEARRQIAVTVDHFVEAPTPSRFVAAVRQVREARRRQRAAGVARALAVRAFARGVARLERLEFLDVETRALLTTQPPAPGAGRRLAALAALLEAHAELVARVRNADAAHVPVEIERPAAPRRR